MWRLLLSRGLRPTILSLHEVTDPDWFRSTLKYLARTNDFVDLSTMVTEYPNRPNGRPRLSITFDDGLKSIYTVVAPVCLDLGIPFTTFVCGDIIKGGPAPWYDRIQFLLTKLSPQIATSYWSLKRTQIRTPFALRAALKELPLKHVLQGLEEAEAAIGIDSRHLRNRYMSEHELTAVASLSIATVGSHTFRHPILANLQPDEQYQEIVDGMKALEGICSDIKFFAYPNGKARDFNASTIESLQKVGIVAAVTTIQRPTLPTDNRWTLPRIGLNDGDSSLRLRLKRSISIPSLSEKRELQIRKTVKYMSGL